MSNTSIENDPLAVPSGTVPERKFPLLVGDKLYAMEIAEVERKASKKDENVGLLKFTLKTLAEATSTDGDVIPPGFPVFHNWTYTPTGGLTAVMINQSGKEIMDACGIPADTMVSALRDNLDLVKGKQVCVKLKVRKASGDFDATNEIARGGWLKAAPTA